MKKLILALLILLVTSSVSLASLKEGSYSIYKGDTMVGEVWVQKGTKGQSIEHWVYYDRDEVIGIAPLSSPDPDKFSGTKRNGTIGIEPNPSPYPNPDFLEEEVTLVRESSGYRNLKDFLRGVDMDEHSRYFKVVSVELDPLPSP